ncbi:uncharacterized protein LOC135343046 isoform X4 [Halichondria panicea]|uniref:uncharacterized protein LOC135343046 isoform X4 n=1 Tax=Halichondria panicea TaxID=6063 RepID=UPI00312B33A8
MCTHQDQGWISSHPKVCEIKAQGIDNSTQTHCAILTYFDLTEGLPLRYTAPASEHRIVHGEDKALLCCSSSSSLSHGTGTK